MVTTQRSSAEKSIDIRLILVLCLWFLSIIAGFSILAHEEFGAAPESKTSSLFPANSAIHLAAGKPTLLLFVHPFCPCTISSLDELSEVLAQSASAKPSVTVIFTIAPHLPDGWKKGHLWALANHMPGVQIFCDQDGLEARRFGVIASGHALLYAPSGDLLFSGGITPSRGHEGDNPGATSVANLMLGRVSTITRTPVFGCPLL